METGEDSAALAAVNRVPLLNQVDGGDACCRREGDSRPVRHYEPTHVAVLPGHQPGPRPPIHAILKMDGTRREALMIPAGGFRLPSSPGRNSSSIVISRTLGRPHLSFLCAGHTTLSSIDVAEVAAQAVQRRHSPKRDHYRLGRVARRDSEHTIRAACVPFRCDPLRSVPGAA